MALAETVAQMTDDEHHEINTQIKKQTALNHKAGCKL